jgi:hypothetical protein
MGRDRNWKTAEDAEGKRNLEFPLAAPGPVAKKSDWNSSAEPKKMSSPLSSASPAVFIDGF